MYYVSSSEPAIVKKYAKKRGWVEKALICGDFQTPNLIIERKRVQDLVDSTKGSRFLSQVRKNLIKLQEENKLVIYIIEGVLEDAKYQYRGKDYRVSMRQLKEMRETIMDLTLAFGIPVMYTENEYDTVKEVTKLQKRSHEIKDKQYHVPPRQIPYEVSDIQAVLMTISGIGVKTSQQVVDKLPATHIKDLILSEAKYKEKGIAKGIITKLNNNSALQMLD